MTLQPGFQEATHPFILTGQAVNCSGGLGIFGGKSGEGKAK